MVDRLFGSKPCVLRVGFRREPDFNIRITNRCAALAVACGIKHHHCGSDDLLRKPSLLPFSLVSRSNCFPKREMNLSPAIHLEPSRSFMPNRASVGGPMVLTGVRPIV